ncbi:MAG: hypothetical protein QOD04_5905, partial [Pseudonocardiales bacterium]|nr:hypothetical protein [Pseudonocardiales bacterium]
MNDTYAATRHAYDQVAVDYARLLEDNLATNIWDRAVLSAFAEHVTAAGGGRVLDLGCGPGRITGHLHELGLDVAGADLSPAMVAEARRRSSHSRWAEAIGASHRPTAMSSTSTPGASTRTTSPPSS